MTTSARAPLIFQFGNRRIDLASRTHIMGILNVSPESFSDGASVGSVDDAVRRAVAMQEDGADIIDIGGASSRPGAETIEPDEEARRVAPVVRALSKKLTVPMSVDTMRSDVARAAVDEGAVIVNDISAGTADPAMLPFVASAGVAMVLMHMKGTPRTMQSDPRYQDVGLEVSQYLLDRALTANRTGITQVMIDPGIGFGKTTAHNLQLIRELPRFAATGYPVVVGPSRKSFIGDVLQLPVQERLEGTSAAVAACIFAGAHAVRVHDVRTMVRVARMCDALKPLPYYRTQPA